MKERSFSEIWQDNSIPTAQPIAQPHAPAQRPLLKLPVSEYLRRQFPCPRRTGPRRLLGIRPRLLPHRRRNRLLLSLAVVATSLCGVGYGRDPAWTAKPTRISKPEAKQPPHQIPPHSRARDYTRSIRTISPCQGHCSQLATNPPRTGLLRTYSHFCA